MFCKECNLELRAIKSRTVLENDDTPDIKTKAFVEHDMMCRNPKCKLYGTIQKTIRNEIPIG